MGKGLPLCGCMCKTSLCLVMKNEQIPFEKENQAESLSGSALHPTAMVINGHHGHQILTTSCTPDLPSQSHSP